MPTKNLSQWNPVVAPPAIAPPSMAPPSSAGEEAAIFSEDGLLVEGLVSGRTRALDEIVPIEQPPVTAVLVFHGIGEEVRFETLSRAAALILTEVEERCPPSASAKAAGRTSAVDSVVIQSVPKDITGNALEVRAELKWTEPDGIKREVHVYEAYWAPLTVGKVTYWETIKFLAEAGWNGLRGTIFSGRALSFQRWLFGGFKELKTTLSTIPLILLLLLLIGFVGAIIAMAGSAVAGVTAAVGTGGTAGFLKGAQFIYHQIVVPWNTGAVWAARLLAYINVCPDCSTWFSHIEFEKDLSKQHWIQAAIAFALWAALIRLSFTVRYFLIQYAGSLVAYLSPYKDSAFEDLRNQIQCVGLNAAKLIYNGHEASPQWIPNYEKVVILGHSLGSVIAYDTLNAMINLEAGKRPQGDPNPAVDRTGALITFGSPLDKTAFLFRVQLDAGYYSLDVQGNLRETMVSAVQPLITKYDTYRFNKDRVPHGPRWINLWSHMDIISGHLDYYDEPVDKNAEDDKAKPLAVKGQKTLPQLDLTSRRVQNLVDPDARKPILAHNQYWTTKLLRKTVYDELF